VIVFTGGIGENRATFRTAVCRDLEELGIRLDPQANASARRSEDQRRGQPVQIWVVHKRGTDRRPAGGAVLEG